MASKFLPGMKNVLEVLNQMWDAFAAGPYNALPLTGGTLTGPVVSLSSIVLDSSGSLSGGDSSTMIRGPVHGGGLSPALVATLGVGGTGGLSYPGQFRWYTSSGRWVNGDTYSRISYDLRLRAIDLQSNVESGDLLVVSGAGNITMPGIVAIGVKDSESQGVQKLSVANCATFSIGSGNFGNSSPCPVNVATNNITGRGVSTGGTFNAGGADYAEYLIKALLCGTIVPGQIVGIDADGRLADKWDRAIAFMVKSTNPCMVGGDSWAQDLGARPGAPRRCEDDTDDTWAAKEAEHAAALAAFDTELEKLRQTVDRIAFAGQVPVNVLGATPGQYIVPVQDGEGIGAVAVDEGDMTLKQCMRAIGKVIAIEGDGRARIIVKVA